MGSAGDAWVAFIEARLAEDEQVADGLMFACRNPDLKPDFTGCGGPCAEEHWKRFDAARMLADAAADRKLLAMYEDQCDYDLPEGARDGRVQEERWIDQAVKEALGEVIKVRAARFSGHADYAGLPSTT